MIMATISWNCKKCGESEASVHQDNGNPFTPDDMLFVYCSECGTEYSASPFSEDVKLSEESEEGCKVPNHDYPETLYTTYGTFSLSQITANSEARYVGNELITHDLVIMASEYDGVIITGMPELFREDETDDMVHYFELDGHEVNYAAGLSSAPANK